MICAVATSGPPHQDTVQRPAPPSVEFCSEPCACPVCDGHPNIHKALFLKQLATFVKCEVCGFVFINPRPTPAWLSSRYQYYGEQYFTEPTKLVSDFRSTRHDGELALLQGATGRLLDVGCATGSFVAAARAAGFDAYGIDISAEATRYGREVLGLPLDVGDLYKRNYPTGTFDLVTFWATLEHLADPNQFLSEASRLLVQGGRLALSVPNYASLTQRILGQQDRYVCIEHLNYFTATTLQRFLERHNFHAETIRTDRFSPVVFWQDIMGATSDGASLERQLADMRTTDRFKYGHGVFAAARMAHGVFTRLLALAGLGDVLYVVGRKAPAR
jgi:SAM-dependent methyltransferase